MGFQKRSLEAKHMGEEPDPRDWEGLDDENTSAAVYDAFRWYYKFYDFKECMNFVQEYYKKNKVKSKSPGKIKITDFAHVGNHVGYIARLKTRGCTYLPEYFENLFISKLKKIEEIASLRKSADNDKPNKIKPDIQKRIRDAAKKLRYDIEDVVDEQLEEEFKKKFNFKQFLEQNKVSKPVDFKEAYSHMSGHQQNRLIKFYDKMIEECEMIIETKKVKKAARYKRKKIT